MKMAKMVRIPICILLLLALGSVGLAAATDPDRLFPAVFEKKAGFINAAGVTLTTGRPIISNGHLEGFRVRSGNVGVNGKGLDTSGADYTRILAQAAQINAGIWATELNMVTGSNDIDAAGQHTAAAPGTSATPALAIDTGSLGGMYRPQRRPDYQHRPSRSRG